MIRLGRRPPRPHSVGPEAIGAHQAGHAPLADPMPAWHEGLPDAGTAVGLTPLPVDHADVSQEDTVRRTSRTLVACAPGVVPPATRRAHGTSVGWDSGGCVREWLDISSGPFAKHAAARKKTRSRQPIRERGPMGHITAPGCLLLPRFKGQTPPPFDVPTPWNAGLPDLR